MNELVPEQLLMELYGPPFAAAVAHAAGVMCAYNRVNGHYACENNFTLRTMLKGRYNFSGFVVSDWGATHSTSQSLQSGLDIEMPNGDYFTEANIRAAMAAGNVTVADIADRCQRILVGWFSLDSTKRYPCGGGICINANVSTPAHKALAREITAKSTVLLKNTGALLPLPKTLKIALIGPDAQKPYTAGTGSGGVTTDAVVSPFAALTAAGITVTYEEGKTAAAAAAAAAAADVAIVFGHAHSGEGSDRANLLLDGNIDTIIPAVTAAQAKTIVYLAVPGAIRTDWRDGVAAILTTFLPGEQIGPALVDTLYGAVPPQGKLPVTFPIGENDQGMSPEQVRGNRPPRCSVHASLFRLSLSTPLNSRRAPHYHSLHLLSTRALPEVASRGRATILRVCSWDTAGTTSTPLLLPSRSATASLTARLHTLASLLPSATSRSPSRAPLGAAAIPRNCT